MECNQQCVVGACIVEHGNGSGKIEVKVDEYDRSGSRSAVVTLAGQNFTKEVTVTQGSTR